MEGKNEEEPKDEVETKIEETLSDDNKQKEAQYSYHGVGDVSC